jgi:LuxR family maltose regulon positive regulatory protein
VSLALAIAAVAATMRRPQAEVEHYIALASEGAVDGPLPMGAHSVRSAVALVRAAIPYDDVGLVLTAAEAAVAEETDPGRHAYVLARAALGHALYLAGRPAEARPLLEGALREPLMAQMGPARINAMAHLAQDYLAAGELRQAQELARRAIADMAAGGMTDYPGLWRAWIALGQVLLHQGHVEEAEAVLVEGLEQRLVALRHTPLAHAEALLALASPRFARGHQQAAHALLAEARAVIEGCTDPGMLSALLADTERRLQRLPRRRTGLHEELTEGELRVLRLLASDLNQSEIGRELYISTNTVKSHIRAIYAKLDASSREAALSRARSLALIA